MLLHRLVETTVASGYVTTQPKTAVVKIAKYTNQETVKQIGINEMNV